MRRGTRVAEAYIALTADGSNIDDDIADSFDDVNWDKHAKQAEKDRNAALRRHLGRDTGDKSSTQGLVRAFRRTLQQIPQMIDDDEKINKSIENMLDITDRTGWLTRSYKLVAREAGVEYAGEFQDAVRASVQRNFRTMLRDAARSPGGVDEDTMSGLMGRTATRDGVEIFTMGPALKQAVKEIKRLNSDLEASTASAMSKNSELAKKTGEARGRLGEKSNKAIAESDRSLLLDQEKARDKIIADALRDQENWLKEHESAVAEEVKQREIAERSKTRMLDSFYTARRNLQRESDNAEKRHLDDMARRWTAHNDAMVDDFRRRQHEQENFNRLVARSAAEAQRFFSNIRFDPRLDRKSIEKSKKELQRLLMDREGLQIKLRGADPADVNRIQRQIEAIDGKIEVYADQDRLKRSLMESENLIDRSGRRIVRRSQRWFRDRDIADRMGRLTGMGARNNFLNLFGRMTRTVTNLTLGAVRGVTALGKGVVGLGKAFMEGAASAGEGASIITRAGAGFAAVGARIAPMIARALASGPAIIAVAALVAIALVALTAVVSALISAVGALLGVLTALVGTLVSGLTGALTVALAAFVPLIAAGGLLTMAFKAMTDEQKKYMKEAFTPLREGFVGMGQVMLDQIIPAFATWSENLQRAGSLLIPLAYQMGSVFAQAGNEITKALSGEGFQRLALSLQQYLPQITLSFSSAIGALLNGFAGMFAALMPSVARFADYLDRTFTRFSTWANSMEGQNAIQDFVDGALEALQSLWNFTREFFGYLIDVWFNPRVQEFGNSMFDGLADSFARLRQGIEDGSLERWMDDAIYFGGKVWETFKAIGDVVETLYSSGMLKVLGGLFDALTFSLEMVNAILLAVSATFRGELTSALAAPMGPLGTLLSGLNNLVATLKWLTNNSLFQNLVGATGLTLGVGANLLGLGGGGGSSPAPSTLGYDPRQQGVEQNSNNRRQQELSQWKKDQADRWKFDWPKMRDRGAGAIALTDLKDPTKGAKVQWVNPYKEWAEGLIKDGPTITRQINKAMKEVSKSVRASIKDVLGADTAKEARQALASIRSELRQQGKSLVAAARSSLNSAASSLANATTPEAAAKALQEVKVAQIELARAQAAQKRLNAGAKILNQQRVLNAANVRRLLAGESANSATLADYARARERLAVRIERAQEKLTEALSLRDEYAKAITASVNSFGSLMTAKAKEIDGVAQALTHQDITSNLQARLQQIRDFQQNLMQLRAMGLSDAAYKELLDAGVENGSAFAEALLAGGIGAITSVNTTTAQIADIAESMGTDAAGYLYQAGVDAAQGLVDGLMARDKQLASAAKHLGDLIALEVKRSLGIASPSQRMIDEMDHVGSGVVVGLRNQHGAVGAAAYELARQINVGARADTSVPEGAGVGGGAGVSGNSAEHHWHITTASENPRTVALEMMNEVVGRL